MLILYKALTLVCCELSHVQTLLCGLDGDIVVGADIVLEVSQVVNGDIAGNN